MLSLIGRQVTVVAIPYQLFSLTHSSLAVGVVGLVQAGPLIVSGLYAGALADRFDRRQVILACVVVQGLCSLALAAGATAGGGRPSIWFIYAVTGLSAAFVIAEHAARTASIARLVGPRRVAAAMSLNQVLFQLGAVAGPAAAGIIIAAFGVRWAYATDAACYLVALVFLFRLRPLPAPAGEKPVVLDFRAPAEALAYTRRTPVLLSIFGVDLVAMIFGLPRALFPALAQDRFHVGPQGLGLLYAAPGAGALAGSLLSGWVTAGRRQGRYVIASVALWGIAITGFGLSGRLFPLALLLLAVAGGADMISAVFRHAIIQLTTPDRLRGRVSALNSMVVQAGPRLGDLEAGGVAALTNPVFSVVSGGLLCLLGLAVITAATPDLRQQELPAEPAAAS